MGALSSVSYEKYLTGELNKLSEHLSIYCYKTAPKDTYPMFEKGKDLRIQIRWAKKGIYEFIVDRKFWLTSNKQNEDKQWMRNHADPKLKMVRDAITRKKKK